MVTLQELGVFDGSSDNDDVSDNALLPPDVSRQPGRSKKCRIQSQNEVDSEQKLM